jgi:hypothetical protein
MVSGLLFYDIINYVALIDKLLLFLVNVVGLELVLWAYIANRYTKPSPLFLMGAIYVLLWINLEVVSAMAQLFFTGNYIYGVALWSARGVYALLPAFFAVFYFFASNFPAANPLARKRRLMDSFQVFAWTFFGVISFSPLVVRDIGFNAALPLAIWVIPGWLFWPYATLAAWTLMLSFSRLSSNRRFADLENRKKAKLVALAAAAFGIVNLFFNIIGSVLTGDLGYIGFFSLIADYMVLVMLGYIAYQAACEKLFGIKVILVEIFVGLMGASLAVMPFFIEYSWQQALLIVLFALFCAFGYSLIRSTIKEYREKELLEKMVADRTQELEKAKQNLEEMNSILEVRVKARTVELEGLNQTLEEKVIERTNDLEKKIKDLETFQRITVGRELKMIELKRENERLRAAVVKLGGKPEQQ